MSTSDLIPTATLEALAYLLLFPENSPHRQGYAIKSVMDRFREAYRRCTNKQDRDAVDGIIAEQVRARNAGGYLTNEGLWRAFECACDVNAEIMADILHNILDGETGPCLAPQAKKFLAMYHGVLKQ